MVHNKLKPKKVPSEVKYEGTYATIPELGMTIKLRKGSTLAEWIIKYCRSNPDMRHSLFPKYGIDIKITGKISGGTELSKRYPLI
jgi:hypothetical protein